VTPASWPCPQPSSPPAATPRVSATSGAHDDLLAVALDTNDPVPELKTRQLLARRASSTSLGARRRPGPA
jgi:hypothetical protein